MANEMEDEDQRGPCGSDLVRDVGGQGTGMERREREKSVCIDHVPQDQSLKRHNRPNKTERCAAPPQGGTLRDCRENRGPRT